MISSAKTRRRQSAATRNSASRRRRQKQAISYSLLAIACSLHSTEAFLSTSKDVVVVVVARRELETDLFATLQNENKLLKVDEERIHNNSEENILLLTNNGHHDAKKKHFFLDDEKENVPAEIHLSKHFGSVENFRKLATGTVQAPHYADKRTSIVVAEKNNGRVLEHDNDANGHIVVVGTEDKESLVAGLDGMLEDLEHGAQAHISEFSDEKLLLEEPAGNTTISASQRRNPLRIARNVWRYVSPVHIFASMDLEDDGAFDSLETTITGEDEPSSTLDSRLRARWRREISYRKDRQKKKKLSNLLKNVNLHQTKRMAGITSRTLTGLILALAEEAEGISVRIDAREETPIWRKQIDSVRIEFTRLGFKPLYMGGPDQQLVSHDEEKKVEKKPNKTEKKPRKKAKKKAVKRVQLLQEDQDDDDEGYDDEDSCPVEYTYDDEGIPIGAVSCADTAFKQIDVDNSGALDKDEIADALVLAATSSSQQGSKSLAEAAAEVGEGSRRAIQQLAKQLVDLYDTNDDGVIDRMEYQSMVEDMAALRQLQKERQQKQEERNNGGYFGKFMKMFQGDQDEDIEAINLNIANATDGNELGAIVETAMKIPEPPETTGKIVLENVKVDLRQVVFGAIPFVKRILPGGPLFLEPLKATVTASFTADDILKSTLCYAGLRQLVTFALRVRVRSLRDLADGAVFYGRKWKRDSSKAPQVECTELISIEIDDQDRAIITGRAKVQASEDAPVIENSFKLRTKVATPRNGRAIKLSEPEIAIVLECPPKWEQNLNATFAKLGMKPPPKPKPIFTYIPIHSPFKKNDDVGGYYMGEDNRLNSLYIKDKCLRFEMEATLRPGKFLGSHYLAFTVPQRALIVTVDRVKEGMKAARRRKKALKALRKAEAEVIGTKAHHAEDALHLEDIKRIATSGASSARESEAVSTDKDESKEVPTKGFISRFVDGYVQAGEIEDSKEKLAHAISDWFGRQGASDSKTNSTENKTAPEVLSEIKESIVEITESGNDVSKVVETIAFEQMRDEEEATKA